VNSSGARALLLLAAGVIAAGTGTARAAIGASPQGFSWFKAAPAPVGWKGSSLRSGVAALFYPPSFHPAQSDSDAVTVSRRSAAGTTLVYLNATDRQGNEQLATWPKSRLAILLEESASSAHEDGEAFRLPFLGGRGTCILDDYRTRIGAHHYWEIACYVVGAKGGSVVVAAALDSVWVQNRALLERAIESYRAS
jgi:hypothetical protein